MPSNAGPISTFLSCALLAITSASSVAAQLVMNTPGSLTTCQNTSLTWSGAASGNAFLSIVPGGQPSATALESFPPVEGSDGTYTWLVDQPAGTSLTFLITDSAGKQTGSAAVTVNPGFNTDCVGKGQSDSGKTTKTDSPSSKSTSSSSSSSDSSSKSNSDSSSNKVDSGDASPKKDTTSGTSSSSSGSKTDSTGSSTTTPSPAPGTTSTITPPTTAPKNVSTTPPPTTNTTSTATTVPATTGKDTSDGATAQKHQQVVFGGVALAVATLLMAV